MLSFSLPFHTFPPSLFLSSLTHTFTTFLPLSFTHSLLLLTHPTPTPFLPVLNHNFFNLLPSIVRLSAVPAAQLKDAVDSLAQTIASLKEQVKKICPHLSYHHAPPLTPLPSHLPLSLISPSSSASFFHFCLVHTFSPILILLLLFILYSLFTALFPPAPNPPYLPQPPFLPQTVPPPFSSSYSIRFISLFHLSPACFPTTDKYTARGTVFQS